MFALSAAALVVAQTSPIVTTTTATTTSSEVITTTTSSEDITTSTETSEDIPMTPHGPYRKFFDPIQWEETQDCFSEFFDAVDGDMSLYEHCCTLDKELEAVAHGTGSLNCQHYRNGTGQYWFEGPTESDPCYPYVESGLQGVTAGWLGYYPNKEWTQCCVDECTDFGWQCDRSKFCRPLEGQADSIFAMYSWYIISCMSLFLFTCVVCCWCVCCSAASVTARKNRHHTGAVHTAAAPVIVAADPQYNRGIYAKYPETAPRKVSSSESDDSSHMIHKPTYVQM